MASHDSSVLHMKTGPKQTDRLLALILFSFSLSAILTGTKIREMYIQSSSPRCWVIWLRSTWLAFGSDLTRLRRLSTRESIDIDWFFTQSRVKLTFPILKSENTYRETFRATQMSWVALWNFWKGPLQPRSLYASHRRPSRLDQYAHLSLCLSDRRLWTVLR